MTNLEQIKQKFYYTPEGEINLNNYGQYRLGLTQEEIKDYLRVRANKMNIDNLYETFTVIAGCNTMALYICPHCKIQIGLMYHHDVLRFANVLFNKTNCTYFD